MTGNNSYEGRDLSEFLLFCVKRHAIVCRRQCDIKGRQYTQKLHDFTIFLSQLSISLVVVYRLLRNVGLCVL